VTAGSGPGQRLSQKLSHGAPLAAIVLVVSAVALFLIYELLPVLKLIAIALLVALALRAIIRGLDRVRFPTWLSVIVLLLGIGTFGAVVWLVMVPNLVEEFRQLTSDGPGPCSRWRTCSAICPCSRTRPGFRSDYAATSPG
jgi:predicted PurR-regulated permease PerM